MNGTLLETRNLTYVYSKGTSSQVHAIRDVCLKIEKGELVGVIGHTGSGKSTLIQHFNGLLKGSSGTVLLDGKDIWEKKSDIRNVRFRVGVCFQYPEYQLFEDTVYKDISFGPVNMGLDREEIDKRVREVISYVGLDESYLEKSPFDLSGGEKRRVAIAGVMSMEPEILIFDEPTAGQDIEGNKRLSEILKVLHEMGKTVITILFDSCFVWLITFPVAFVLCSYTSLSILAIYAICQSLNIIKCIAGYILVENGIWIKNIV